MITLKTKPSIGSKLLGGVSVAVLAGVLATTLPIIGSDFVSGAAFAQDNGNGQGAGSGGNGAGSGGANAGGGHDGDSHDSDSDSDSHDSDSHDSDSHESGKKGGSDHDSADASSEDEDSDGRGPNYGQPEGGDTGGKPTWAQEGIPEVELGRLNVARSPDHVLEQALAEAVATFDPSMLAFYNLTVEQAVAVLINDWDNLTIFDSPLQNLALLDEALGGSSSLAALGVTNDMDTLAAIFLGVASDKVVTISDDTVEAVSKILGHDLTDAEISALAADAEAIRAAVLLGHG